MERSDPPGSLIAVRLVDLELDLDVFAGPFDLLLTLPAKVDVRHIASPKVTVAERLSHLRELLRRGRFSFDEAVTRADRVTVAVTLFAVLELYKQGELTWTQDAPFGDIVLEPVGSSIGSLAAPNSRVEAA